MKIACIGDVHGNYRGLTRILKKLGIENVDGEWTSTGEYFVVQLGDITDTPPFPNLSSVRCLEIMMELTFKGFAQVLYSNHHDKLKRHLNGNKVTPSHGLQGTIEELNNCSMDFQGQVYTWLFGRPLTYSFEENGITYRCVHAYFDQHMLNISSSDDMNSRQRDMVKSTCIYGLTAEGERVRWWEDGDKYNPDTREKQNDFFLISGHYHVFKRGKKFHVLDSEKALMCWIPSEDRYIGTKKWS